MREINSVIVHCSYTPPEADIGADIIRQWHVEDNGWSDIGYHYVIKRDGTLEEGRPIERAGAHTKGHNSDSIGICLVGGMNSDKTGPELNFTYGQYLELSYILKAYTLVDEDTGIASEYLDLDWFGHRDFDSNKQCPCFDVGAFVKSGIIKPTV